MKVMKYKKSQEADIKKEIQSVYELLKYAYRHQAGLSPMGNIFCIGTN